MKQVVHSIGVDANGSTLWGRFDSVGSSWVSRDGGSDVVLCHISQLRVSLAEQPTHLNVGRAHVGEEALRCGGPGSGLTSSSVARMTRRDQ